MKRTFVIILLYSIAIPQLISQVNYDKIRIKKLITVQIDTLTEPVLIIKKRNATVVFRQSDIKDYIKANANTSSSNGLVLEKNVLLNLFATNDRKFVMTDWWSDYTDDERRIILDAKYPDNTPKYLDGFHLIGTSLIYEGKFMVIDNHTNKIVIKGLKMKRIDGLYGTKYLDCLLPSKKSFWEIITRIGE